MNWLVKTLANENKYFSIFLGTLFLYALIGTILFGVSVNYAPSFAKYIATLFLLGSAVLAAGARITHNLCYAKVMQDESKDSV